MPRFSRNSDCKLSLALFRMITLGFVAVVATNDGPVG